MKFTKAERFRSPHETQATNILASAGYSEARIAISEHRASRFKTGGGGRKALMRRILRRMKKEGYFAFANDATEALRND